MDTRPSDREFRIVEAALALESTTRATFLEQACAGDPGLLRRASELVDAIEKGDASREIFERVMPALEGIAAQYSQASTLDVGALESLGKYRIERELGRGGQGVVYLAVDSSLSRRVALKVLHPAAALDPGTRARFQREAGIASRLDHPAICAVYETGTERGIDFIAMRYVEGQALVRRILEQPSVDLRGLIPTAADSDPIHTIAMFIEKIARALHLAHEPGVIHRDVKSGNILVTPDGEPVILDFGLAREATPGTTLTASGDIVGTPIFMSPEQVSGPVRALDRRTDVWSLGVVLYHCLALELPFEAPTIHEIMRRIREEEPLPIRSRNPAIPRDLAVIVHTALEKDVTRRYRTALALAEDLRRFREHETILARPASLLYRATRYAKRHPFRVAAGLMALTTVVLGIMAGVLRASNDELAVELLRHDDLVKSKTLLRDEQEKLWPVRPEAVDLCNSWLATRNELLPRRADHERMLERLRGRRNANGESLDGFDSLVGAILEEHILNLDRIAALEANIVERRERSSTLRARSIDSHTEDWGACIDAIAASPHYSGLRIAPQIGLVPLGPNTGGYFEFWLVESGARPATIDAGGLVITPDTGLVLILLPGGEFTMGCTKEPGPRFDPYHEESESIATVNLDPYFVSKYEMTQAQWHRIMAVNPSQLRAPNQDGGVAIDERHPVEAVSWEQCVIACARLGLILPTEAQWEYACRGGTDTVWATGNDPIVAGNSGNYLGAEATKWFDSSAAPPPYRDAYVRHAPVGSFPPNNFGAHDMHGNVSEWCSERYVRIASTLTPSDGTGRREPAKETHLRPTRGGHFADSPRPSRSGGRYSASLESRGYNVGLRPVLQLMTWKHETR